MAARAGRKWPPAPPRPYTDAVRLPSGVVILTGLEGVLLTSRDGGRTVSTTRLTSRQGISSVLALADGTVLLTGEFGVRRLPRPE